MTSPTNKDILEESTRLQSLVLRRMIDDVKALRISVVQLSRRASDQAREIKELRSMINDK